MGNCEECAAALKTWNTPVVGLSGRMLCVSCEAKQPVITSSMENCEQCAVALQGWNTPLARLSGRKLCRSCEAKQPPITFSMGNCQQCGAALDAPNTRLLGLSGRNLCTSCDAKRPSIAFTMGNCEQCGAAVSGGDLSLLSHLTGQRLCASCRAKQSLLLRGSPALRLSVDNVNESLSGLLHGTLTPQVTPIIGPREERIAFLEQRVRELEESAGQSGDLRKALDRMKRELEELKKRLISGDEGDKQAPLDFDGLCKILSVWIPRRLRKFEEAYKAELGQYLTSFSANVEEEPQDGITDILVEGSLPIELKVDPTKGQYNELCGKLRRVVAVFGRATVVILRVSSLERFEAFLKIVDDMGDTIRVFPKA